MDTLTALLIVGMLATAVVAVACLGAVTVIVTMTMYRRIVTYREEQLNKRTYAKYGLPSPSSDIDDGDIVGSVVKNLPTITKELPTIVKALKAVSNAEKENNK